MQKTQAFQLHASLSANARSQTAAAISLDENSQVQQALVAYDRAIQSITAYLNSFSITSKPFQQLALHERQVVIQTTSALDKHLKSVQARVQTLRSPSGNTRPSTLSRDDPLVKAIESEILDNSSDVQWDDIYGLEDAKRALNEMVVLPAQRPDLYTGLRAPGKGILLFGPPGTGKTLIAKAVATNVNATFFSISASSLNSKFHGESEKLVRTLFQVARERQPAFIFIDEVDSILGSRGDNEHEASRRLKTEFMAQFDGAMGKGSDQVYVMAASNRPQDLDDAVRRRLDRRIYVPLPDMNGRKQFLVKLTAKDRNVKWTLSDAELQMIAKRTMNYSGSDMKALCREASLMPLRELGAQVSRISVQHVRPCTMRDFEKALDIVRPSSNIAQIRELEDWNEEFGSQAKGRKPGVARSLPAGKGHGGNMSASKGSGQMVRSSPGMAVPRPKGGSSISEKWISFVSGSKQRR